MLIPTGILSPNPVTQYVRYAKIALVVGIIILIGGMAMYIKIQEVDLESAENKLAISEANIKTLNSRVHDQNLKIKLADEKFELVQTALNNTAKTNKLLKDEFAKIKGDLKDRPVPTTCEDITDELIDTSKKVVQKWKKQ